MGEEIPRADLEKRVIQLEELYSHQQHLVQQLDEELVKLRSVIEKLEYRHVVQEDRLKWLIDNRLTLDDLPNEKPPHY
ncbi:MAG: SlyX family protein [Planctomycetota bacterium]|nr:SlyX family protein [Planctomycetota bacterium]MEC9116831.1 SlyX family protein [Planctomycetota bacterium]